MTQITNHMPTKDLQALDAAHHMHPFTEDAALARKGARIITRGKGVWLTDSEGQEIIDGMAGRTESHLDRTVVKFRELSDAEIDRYIERDQPLDCAGGFKAEALGIALFDRIESVDPTGLTGLPLSWLCGALRRARVPVP